MSEKQQTFDVAELDTLKFRCPKCATEILFHATTDETFGVPRRCPTCDDPLGAAAQAFSAFRLFYRHVVAGGLPIQVQSKPVRE